MSRTRSSSASEADLGEGTPARLPSVARTRSCARPRVRTPARRRTPPPPRRRPSQAPPTTSPLTRRERPGRAEPDLVGASLLGAIAGGVDAAGWFCLAGLLPSHLTASLVMLGARVAEYDAADVRARMAMLPVFVCTVATVKWSARWMTARKLPVLPVLLTMLTLGLALFCTAGSLSDALLADDPRMLLWIGGLGVASMAVQNAIMRLCLAQLCPTTVMTGNLTQLVMAAVDLLARRQAEPGHDARSRLINAGSPLLGFLLGSISCGFVASRRGLVCLLMPLALSAAITALSWRRWRAQRQAAGGPTMLFPLALVPRSPSAL